MSEHKGPPASELLPPSRPPAAENFEQFWQSPIGWAYAWEFSLDRKQTVADYRLLLRTAFEAGMEAERQKRQKRQKMLKADG